MRRGRGRSGAIGIAIVVVATAIGALVGSQMTPVPPGPAIPSDQPGGAPGGPVVYYETLDAEAARLFARTLDGRSPARQVAARFDADGPVWTVDPTGSIALAGTGDGDAGPGLVAVDVATGAQRWAIPTKAPLDIRTVVWGPDSTRLAGFLDDPVAVTREVGLVDVAAGTIRFATVPNDVGALHGFGTDGGLVLQRLEIEEATATPSWRFVRVDPATGATDELGAPPSAAPAGDGYSAAAPAAGVGIDQAAVEARPGVSIRLWDLTDATSRILATFPAIDRIGFDPRATGVVVSGSDDVRFVTLDGASSSVFSGDAPIADVAWSTPGDYLVVTTDQPRPGLTVVERGTGRSVRLPIAGPAQSIRFVGMPGGIGLPSEPLPAAEPTPTPTAGPSGSDVAGLPGVLAGSIDETTGRFVVHAQRLVPTERGGLRVVAEMPAFELGAVDPADPGPPGVLLVPRPGSADVLVWITTADGSRGWLWTSGGSVEPLALPADWPANVGDIVWRPDGGGLAASASRPLADGGFEPDFVVAELGARRTTVIPVVGDYDRLEGWWSPTELRVGHGACFEGCPASYADWARLRVADRRLTLLGPADRATTALDDVLIERDELVLSTITGDASDDLRIGWPGTLGPAGSLTLVGSIADARELVLARSVGGETELYRILDVAGRAVDGRLARPDPVRIAAIRGRDLQVALSPDRAWALVTDRVDETRLVRLSDGRTWPVDRGRILAWAGDPDR